MKTAIATWNNRVAPVYDAARTFVLIEQTGTVLLHKEVITLADEAGQPAVEVFRRKEVSRVICGAISREHEELLVTRGIEVRSFVAGYIDEVINAIEKGIIENKRFSMPGCGCPRRTCGRRKRRGWNQENK